jgi:hypothetical protein
MGKRPSTGAKREVSPALAEARSRRFKEMHERKRAEALSAEAEEAVEDDTDIEDEDEEEEDAAVAAAPVSSKRSTPVSSKNPFDLAAGLLKRKG